jgi:hypothetical protein
VSVTRLTFLRLRQIGATAPSLPFALELALNQNDLLTVKADHHTGTSGAPVATARTIYTNPGVPITRGRWYEAEVYFTHNTAGAGNVRLDWAGSAIFNQTVATGFFGATGYQVEYGISRPTATEDQSIDWVWDETTPFTNLLTTGGAGTGGVATPTNRTLAATGLTTSSPGLGMPFLNGLVP